MTGSLLNWPDFADRTPADAREDGGQFDVAYRRTVSELGDEFDLLGVEEWQIYDVTGSGGDPGVVLRWRKGAQEYVAACDQYTSKTANVRALYLWLNETRMRAKRPVKTARESMAAAALPQGDGEEPVVAGEVPPHKVLGVDADADGSEIREAFQERVRAAHPDHGGSMREVNRVRDAYQQLME